MIKQSRYDYILNANRQQRFWLKTPDQCLSHSEPSFPAQGVKSTHFPNVLGTVRCRGEMRWDSAMSRNCLSRTAAGSRTI